MGNYKLKHEIKLGDINLHFSIPLEKKKKNYIKRPLIIFFELLRLNPDIVIQRGSGTTTGYCALYCKLFGKKFIFSIANAPNVNGTDERGVSGKIFKFGIENASYIIAQTYLQVKELQNYKGRKFSNIKVIRSGYEIQKPEIIKKSHILWVARAVRWKRPEIFLNLAKKFNQLKFIMICQKGVDQDYWENIYHLASKISNVEFIKFIPFKDIDEYFKDAKIFINSSIYEGFPNTFIQSLKNCTPIISLNVDPDNILKNYNIGFFCNDDISKAELYLTKLIEDKDLYKNISQNAYLHALNNYDIEAIGKIWANLIIYLFNTYKKCAY